MSSDPTIRTFQALGLTSALLLSGINIGSSLLTIPLLQPLDPEISAPFFHAFYLRGAASLVPLGIFSATCSAVVAYMLPGQRRTWILVAALAAGQTPWTLLVMMGVNGELIRIAEGEQGDKEVVAELLGRWAWMNLVRGGLALGAGVVGLMGVMER